MSYLKTINIQHLTSGTNNIVLDANGNMTCAGTISAATPTGGMRNKIINGAMEIDQRNAGASVSIQTTTGYMLDRWTSMASQNSKFSIQQNAGSVTPPAGFINYLGCTSSSTYALAAGDYFGIYQRIEGLNTADLAWGTSNAKSITLSFWVRSSLTGTFGGAARNSASDRGYPFTYTINSSNTWEYKTIVVPGDTTGTWLTTNGVGLSVQFSIGTGSTYSFAPGAWGSYSAAISATGTTSVVGTNGATWYITGVQVEAGSVATAFERRQYGTELALCQRYLPVFNVPANSFLPIFAGSNISTSTGYVAAQLPVEARVAPTGYSLDAGTLYFSNATGGIAAGTVTFWAATTRLIGLYNSGSSGLVAGYAQMMQCSATVTKIFCTGCEL